MQEIEGLTNKITKSSNFATILAASEGKQGIESLYVQLCAVINSNVFLQFDNDVT